MNLQIHCLTYNPFEENTYVLSAPSGKCLVIDPGCFDEEEREHFKLFLAKHSLIPARLINTHCHIDHILGNAFITREYGLGLEIHEGELLMLEAGPMVAGMYQMPYEPSPAPQAFLAEGDIVNFEGCEMRVLLTPGHSPASICLYNARDHWLIAGDVLFYESIGRTDLPGGNYHTLLKSIREKLFILPDNTVVYPGHGEPTTIGHERYHNPFLTM